jgi:UDP-glucose:glycoprotein glucosyltransferase
MQAVYGQVHRVPPNGLQLTLSRTQVESEQSETETASLLSGLDQTDTLIMQNLGYFQLKANPGLWKLSLAEGRASQLYTISDSEDFDSNAAIVPSTDQPAGTGKFIAVKSFADVTNKLMVVKRPGMERIPLLQDSANTDTKEEESGGMGVWDSITSMFGASDKASSRKKSKKKVTAVVSADPEDNRIHVFSLATGHMYERLLRIMMLSVTKRTSMPVKVGCFIILLISIGYFYLKLFVLLFNVSSSGSLKISCRRHSSK